MTEDTLQNRLEQLELDYQHECDGHATEKALLLEQIEKLKKEVADANNGRDYWMRENQSLNTAFASVHHVLDCLPTPPPRDDSFRFPPETETWKFHTYTLAERLAIWLGNK